MLSEQWKVFPRASRRDLNDGMVVADKSARVSIYPRSIEKGNQDPIGRQRDSNYRSSGGHVARTDRMIRNGEEKSKMIDDVFRIYYRSLL